MHSLGRRSWNSSVTKASVESSSTMIFTAISTIAGVRGTRVYIPRRLTNRSIDSSKSISASPQDNTPLAAWLTWMLVIDMHGLEKVTNIKQDSETSLYCFHSVGLETLYERKGLATSSGYSRSA